MIAPLKRWARAGLLAVLVVLAGSACAPPVDSPAGAPTTPTGHHGTQDASPEGGAATAPAGDAASVDAAEEDAADEDAADEDVERALREATVRVRATGCGRLGTGSGFMLDRSMLVTNRHVVDDATQVQLNTWDGVSLQGAFVAVAFYSDLALAALDDELATTIPLAPHDPRPGEPVIVAGYPGGGVQDASPGTVLDYIDARDVDFPDNVGKLMRLDATVRPGSSGGPVADHNGEVVGVVYASNGRYGFAIPVSTLRSLADRVRSGDAAGIGPPRGC
ncbi:MAG: trypsin-like serine protease [Nitriliruptorales bacterium]|nr:trypsin-like serine protease [Nitriliruptorales bacterium]